jgi:4-alpha-glucanotransferase
MGLHRLYWIPPGNSAEMGAYVRYPAEELYAVLNLESHRHRTVLVGENLGTVPPEVNSMMARHQVRQTYVLQYEQRPEPKSALRAPPALSVASVNTHDMPPFRAHFTGADVAERVRLNLFPKTQAESELKNRKANNAALQKFLSSRGLLSASESKPEDVLQACLEWLAQSDAETVLITLEDFWGEEQWQNMPCTTTEYPNWRRKMKLTLEEILQSEQLRAKAVGLSQQRKSRNRETTSRGASAVGRRSVEDRLVGA